MIFGNKLELIECEVNSEIGWYLTVGGKDIEDLEKLREYIRMYGRE